MGGTVGMVVMIVVVIAVFYFFGMRPQKKQEREQQEMRNNLAVGDEITTIGGIIGKVVSIKEETMVIETTRDHTRIRLLKSAVRSVDVPANVKVLAPEPVVEEAPVEEKPTKKRGKKSKKNEDEPVVIEPAAQAEALPEAETPTAGEKKD
ncbi:MAG: preprotein translocase subunit YajC [Clostridia bacterium]|nr:preprotein translocase subunit YajC [Clostridia bacterium]